MTLRSPSTKGKPPYLVCHYRYCDNVSTPYDIVEKRVLDTLKEWAEKYKLKETQSKKNSSGSIDMLKSSVESAKKKVATLQQQLDGMCDLLEQGIYTPDMFRQRSVSVTERITKAKAEYEQLSEQLVSMEKLLTEKSEFNPKVEHVLKIYDTLSTPADKNRVLKEVIDHAEYSKAKSGAYKGVSVDDFNLTVFPKMPL